MGQEQSVVMENHDSLKALEGVWLGDSCYHVCSHPRAFFFLGICREGAAALQKVQEPTEAILEDEAQG